MRVLIRLLPLLISTALVHGCFTEASSSDGEGEGCPDGTAGCDCYGNGTCDNGLECVEGKCYEPDCTPGSELCRCVAGLCLGDLVCVENVCRPPSDDGTGGDGGDGTDGDGGDGGDGTGGDDGGTDTGGDGTGGDDGGTATGGPPDCNPSPDDLACIACAKDYCCELLQVCIEEMECSCILECIAAGEIPPMDCGPQCGPSEVFMQVETCLYDFCANDCPIGGGECQVPPDAPGCTLCAADMCCPQLEACWAWGECSCMENCLSNGGAYPDCEADCGYSPDLGPELENLQSCAAEVGCMDEYGDPCYAG